MQNVSKNLAAMRLNDINCQNWAKLRFNLNKPLPRSDITCINVQHNKSW